MTKSIEMDRPEQKEDLWDHYRSAFDKWARQVGQLAQAQEHPHENGALVEAQHQTSLAEAMYRESRDWLMEKIANPKTGSLDEPASSTSDTSGKIR